MLPVEEHEVAGVMVAMILQSGESRAPSLEEFADWFGRACHQCRFEADVESYKRIRAEVCWRIGELAREAGQLAAATSPLAAPTRKGRRWR